ncbi:MAG: twin-arginine translocase TatA/TatE family subunit [candidate division Zixibacteria bacterium]|nr:twin-arginine translocase TatA/TatE family subunit [candidate division Zixibacteria bacterium]
MGGIGVQELLLIFLVVLLLFGAKRIPDIAHSLGKGVREFKKAMDSANDELTRSIDDSKSHPTTGSGSGSAPPEPKSDKPSQD